MPDGKEAVGFRKREKSRLHEVQASAPWIRAEALNDCYLYWLPVSAYPMRSQEREWMNEFIIRLVAAFKKLGLRDETFFQYSEITEELGTRFLKHTAQKMKLMGWGRSADASMPAPPSMADLKKIQDSGEGLDTRQWFANFLIWFMAGGPEQRAHFSGNGGMLTLLLPSDPKAVAPSLTITPKLRSAMPVFQKVDVDGMIAGTFAMRDSFLSKSKDVFGVGLEERPEYPGIPFILPLLDSGHFFAAATELRRQWFDIFDIYIRESRNDGGILLAFGEPAYEDVILDVLQSMREEKAVYPQQTYQVTEA